MPVFREGEGQAPTWCEMTHFEIVHLLPGQRHTFVRVAQKEKLIVGQGSCRITYNDSAILAERGTNLDLTSESGQFEITDISADTILIRMCGHWGDKLGGSGLFAVTKSEHPQDKGDAVDYPKETNFDCHYHDCDEYWILFKGEGVAVSEGKHYAVRAGDCVATGMGHHHDFPLVSERVEAVFFETTMQGQMRRGHLWNHTHGPAQPKHERT
jgi:mannose-6-phosphate isomerase-like protein (cupin superfamily)